PTAANTVEFRAKQPGTESNLVIGFVDWTPEFLEQQNGTDLTDVESVLLRLRLRMTDTQQALHFKEGPWMEYVPEIDGTGVWEADVNLSEMADAMMQGLDVPDIAQSAELFNAVLSARRYYVEAAAYDVPTGLIGEMLATNKGLLLKGGRKTVEHGVTSDSYLAAKGWLTNRPNEVLTHKNVADYLWLWVPKSESSDLEVKVTAYFEDGTEMESTDLPITTLSGKLVGFGCGWEHSIKLIFISPPSVPYKYEIEAYLQSGGEFSSQLAEKITFWLAPDTVNHGAVHYFNSFGLLEAQYCTGAMQIERDYERETIRKVLPVLRNNEDMAQRVHGILQQEKLKVTTGPLTKEQQAGAMDMVLSERLWWLNVNVPVAEQQRIACNVAPATVVNTQVNWQGDQYAAVECELVFDEQRDQSTAYNLIGL
ncbi:hypothetical protein UFOVP350_50, partial [uncultured Caudovirales phage]